MSKYAHYLFDLGLYIKERALDARRERDSLPKGSSEREFQSGRLLAFNEVISIMQQHAEGMDIPLADLRLDEIDPDRDLT
jgi:hypothetical protein